MTHMTETRRTIAPRRPALDRGKATQPMGIPSAVTGGVASRAFALRGGNGIEGRAFPKGEDS